MTMETAVNENIANELFEETANIIDANECGMGGLTTKQKIVGGGALAIATGIAIAIFKNRKKIARKVGNIGHRVSGYVAVEEGNEPELEAENVEVHTVK